MITPFSYRVFRRRQKQLKDTSIIKIACTNCQAKNLQAYKSHSGYDQSSDSDADTDDGRLVTAVA